MDHDEARTRILDAAEKLFYDRGIQSVGMDELRTTAGVSLKRLYQCFPAKHDLVEAYLRRRDTRWRTALTAYVTERADTPEARPLAVFDWLHDWFTASDFRGCAFINSFGELGATSDGVARVARDHKRALLSYLTDLARDAQLTEPTATGEQLALLVDGAITTAAITGNPSAAQQARTAAEALLAAARTPTAPGGNRRKP
ncbi:TetR/AcrR family transcriptional regulator [Streptomyces sioyaensis]|uniref:TetR/AcrR family transcriptional regulator n=1 Tax=Streptomyces sioyaensis TaxID=67364 RepID=UPI001F34E1D3|nr:TetR/AcrR family transcriptional regulator [Streptomyces sioyaensis]MCF3177151.1 TetR/AcrR family transcriptional regulator [Streptomyces sioyaensis]